MSVPKLAPRVAVTCSESKGVIRCADAGSAEGMTLKQAEADRARELYWASRGIMKKTASGSTRSITARRIGRKGRKPRRTQTPFQKAWKSTWKIMKRHASRGVSFDKAINLLSHPKSPRNLPDVPKHLEAKVMTRLQAYKPQYMALVKRGFIRKALNLMSSRAYRFDSFSQARRYVMRALDDMGIPHVFHGQIRTALDGFEAKYQTLREDADMKAEEKEAARQKARNAQSPFSQNYYDTKKPMP